jgi:segregation and condensation protein B
MMRKMEIKQTSPDYKKTIEAALFVSGRAMEVDEIAKVVGIASPGHVKKILEELISDYQTRDSSLVISKVGDKYTLGVKNEYAEKVNSLAGTPEISKSSLRILAYISKNEPVMQSSVVKAFGSSTYDHMKELLENEFVRTMKVGRTKKIETTNKFKEYFNLN